MKILLIITLFSFVNVSFAIPTKKIKEQKIEFEPGNELIEAVGEALKLPLENRMKTLNRIGSQSRLVLEQMARDGKNTLQVRWRAITALGRLYPIKSMKILEDMAQSQEWFLRNAAAIAMSNGERTWAVNWAKRLLNDSALVVRTAAVQTLGKLKAVEAEDELWTALYSHSNYSNGKSLWIRRHIVEALAHISTYGKQGKFIRILYDNDKSLHKPAVLALNKLLKGRYKVDGASTPVARKKWISWWNEKYTQSN